jgi:hypothetical protein
MEATLSFQALRLSAVAVAVLEPWRVFRVVLAAAGPVHLVQPVDLEHPGKETRVDLGPDQMALTKPQAAEVGRALPAETLPAQRRGREDLDRHRQLLGDQFITLAAAAVELLLAELPEAVALVAGQMGELAAQAEMVPLTWAAAVAARE